MAAMASQNNRSSIQVTMFSFSPSAMPSCRLHAPMERATFKATFPVLSVEPPLPSTFHASWSPWCHATAPSSVVAPTAALQVRPSGGQRHCRPNCRSWKPWRQRVAATVAPKATTSGKHEVPRAARSAKAAGQAGGL